VYVGEIWSTSDGGSSWLQGGPTNDSGLDSVSCPSTTDCVAVGLNSDSNAPVAAFTSDDGSSWTAGAFSRGVHDLLDVSCGSTTHCIAVGQNGLDRCSATGCTAVGDINSAAVELTTNGGASWTLVASPLWVHELKAVSCPSATECVAVGNENPSDGGGAAAVYTLDGGRTWYPGLLGTLQITDLEDVSCPSVRDCVAVGSVGSTPSVVFTTNGGQSWRQ
jgi:photosystem II stability/assembly factor-like uncharacterized protein